MTLTPEIMRLARKQIARETGSKGGKSKSPAKLAAARANLKKANAKRKNKIV